VQAHMHVVSVKLCDFVEWTRNAIGVTDIPYDEDLMVEKIGVAGKFFERFVCPSFANKLHHETGIVTAFIHPHFI
ncbi:hypothetical protein HK096_000975, partial [Nowakowskiella sp. JEL0078]